MANDLVPVAASRIRSLLDALYAYFSIAAIREMVMADDLSPLEQEVERTYSRIAEIALALFLADLARAARDASAQLVLDSTRWRIVEEQAHIRAALARALADDQKRVLRDILRDSNGESARLVATRIKNALGLTQPLYEGVLRYERVAAMPTRYELDRRDLTTPEQLSVMTGTYARDYRRLRADVLGLVEGQRARGRADLEAYRQAAEFGLVDPSRLRRTWNILNRNTRDSHIAMQGQVRTLEDPFESGLGNRLMYPGDGAAPAQDVVNCQCWVTYSSV